MIVFNVIQHDEDVAREISAYVIKNNYALHAHIDVNVVITEEEEIKTVRVFFLTKALLYNTIETEILEKFKAVNPIIYSTPVSQINMSHASLLRTGIKAI